MLEVCMSDAFMSASLDMLTRSLLIAYPLLDYTLRLLFNTWRPSWMMRSFLLLWSSLSLSCFWFLPLALGPAEVAW